MQVRVLGCSGAIAKGCRTTSFLLGNHILVDAGTGVGDLTLDEMQCIDHVLLTHSHLDHIAALPLMLDAVSSRRTYPVQLHALPETLEALHQHIFNDIIWPDFTRIPTARAPFLSLQPFATGDLLNLSGTLLEVLPASHSVPAVGYAARGATGWWVYSGDTDGQDPRFWSRVNALHEVEGGVAALFIETAFSNREEELARKSRHLSPESLMGQLLSVISPVNFPIYITHAKPHESELIMQEIRALELGACSLIDLQTVPELEV
ncbi:MAG: 3',5'-cyclic-nucleotide phosphodiesterase [Acidovorax sp.]|nr:MAG: 3',5'-cyclic-nucleotide phosphodiesterase [Acidovorax sp.]